VKVSHVALVGVAVIALLLGFWFVQQRPPPQQPALPAALAPSVSPAVPVAASANLPTPAAELPAPVTVLGILAKEHGVHARRLADAPKVMELAIYKAGGEAALRPFRQATLRWLRSGAVGRSEQEVLADGAGSVLVRDVAAELDFGLVKGQCWWRQRGVVLPCDKLRRAEAEAALWIHAAVTLLNLRQPPWQVVSAGGVTVDGRLLAALGVSGPGVAETTLLVEPEKGRPVRLENRLALVEFSDDKPFAGAQLPTALRVRLPPEASDPRQRIEYTLQINDIRPGVSALPTAAPAPTRSQPLTVAPLPPMQVWPLSLPSHDGLAAALQGLGDAFSFSEVQVLDVYELFGTSPAVWVAVPPGPIGDRHRDKLQAMPAVAMAGRQVQRLAWADLPAAVARLTQELAAAGHPASSLPARVRYLTPVNPDDPVSTVELIVPVEK
jgi:hypothetical protein